MANTPAEIILIGGAAILADYGFREATDDMDAIITAPSAMEDAIRAVGLNPLSHGCVLKTYRNGYMDMAVDDAGHDELPAKVRDLALIRRKPGLVAHIDEYSIDSAKFKRVFQIGKSE